MLPGASIGGVHLHLRSADPARRAPGTTLPFPVRQQIAQRCPPHCPPRSPPASRAIRVAPLRLPPGWSTTSGFLFPPWAVRVVSAFCRTPPRHAPIPAVGLAPTAPAAASPSSCCAQGSLGGPNLASTPIQPCAHAASDPPGSCPVPPEPPLPPSCAPPSLLDAVFGSLPCSPAGCHKIGMLPDCPRALHSSPLSMLASSPPAVWPTAPTAWSTANPPTLPHRIPLLPTPLAPPSFSFFFVPPLLVSHCCFFCVYC